ncbi:ectoine/hydroxyectoine ABC transporter ATP-binding protein EhuA [Pseudomonas mangiferae]|nr:ectoine/hydroxyectoine ABC transporter ATP-binding protein EhuA [Pseudomonas mangiferae]
MTRLQTPCIEFHDVSKRYGDLQVLNGVSFQARPGEKLSLIGPSGSGKTTILRVLMTLESIDGGTVRIEGEPLRVPGEQQRLSRSAERGLQRIRGKVGMVFQHFNLFPHMDVLRNITLGPMLTQGVSRDEAEAQALRYLDMVGLADKARSRPSQLSGGQKQRVAIARSLALKPKIMLFDEVTSALDPELVDEVLAVMRTLARETDMTMLLVTHAMNFARDFSDRVLFFERGRILEEGPPQQIFSEPREERTRTFLRKILASGQDL